MGESKTSPRRLKAAEREEKAMRLRLMGATYKEIGEKLGISDVGAYKAVKRVRDRHREVSIDLYQEMLDLDIQRIDYMIMAIWQAAMDGNLGAISEVRGLQRDREKLLGYGAPHRVAPTDPSGKQPYEGKSDVIEIIVHE